MSHAGRDLDGLRAELLGEAHVLVRDEIELVVVACDARASSRVPQRRATCPRRGLAVAERVRQLARGGGVAVELAELDAE